MARFWQNSDNPDPLFARRVGLPDDAQRELALRNLSQHGARTSWDGDFAPHRRPDSKILERSLGIFPRWRRDRIGNRKLAAADCIREREIWPNGQRKPAVGRGNENKSVAEQVLPRAQLDQIALGKIIHRGNITGEENIARHPTLDLPGQRCARPNSGHDPGAALTSERVVRLVERLLEGDRAEHHKISAFSASRRDEQGRQHGQAQYRQASSAKDGSNHAGSGAGDTTSQRRAWTAMVVVESQISSNLHHRKCSVLTWKLEAYMSC